MAYLSFKSNPLRPLDYKNNKRWEKTAGGVYVLNKKDVEADKQFTPILQLKEFDPEIKAYDPHALMNIQGVANANIVDRVDERLDPRGCMVQSYLKNPQLLAHHCYHYPIGQVTTLNIEEGGVTFGGWVGDPSKAPLTAMQIEMRSLLAQGIIRTVSVGFIPLKIRAPLYNNNGGLEEALVIEQWELLEISLVAVPCNQDSLIEVVKHLDENGKRYYAVANGKSLNDIPKITADLASKNLFVQTLSLAKSKFTKDTATKWAQENGFKTVKHVELATAHIFQQTDLKNINQAKRVELTEGVFAMTNQKEDDSSQGQQVIQEMNSLLQSVAQQVTGIVDKLEAIYQKMEAKPTEPPKEPKPGEDEPAKQLAARVEKLESAVSDIKSGLDTMIKYFQPPVAK